MPRKYEPETEIMRPGMLPPRLLWKGAAVMDKTQFEQIKQHGAMLAIAGHLHKRGLITDAEHHKLTEEIQKKYRPASGSAAGFSPVLNNLTEKVPGKEDLGKQHKK